MDTSPEKTDHSSGGEQHPLMISPSFKCWGRTPLGALSRHNRLTPADDPALTRLLPLFSVAVVSNSCFFGHQSNHPACSTLWRRRAGHGDDPLSLFLSRTGDLPDRGASNKARSRPPSRWRLRAYRFVAPPWPVGRDYGPPR